MRRWVPNSALGLCSGIPDPFVIIGGGICINGGWVPRTAGTGEPAPEMTTAAAFQFGPQVSHEDFSTLIDRTRFGRGAPMGALARSI